MITPRAIGGRYYRVVVNGVEWSIHTTWYLAGDAAQDVGADAAMRLQAGEIEEFPLIQVREDATVVYEYDPVRGDVPDTYDPTVPAPQSDSGEDLIDFLSRVSPVGEMDPLPGGSTLDDLYRTAAYESKKMWLIKRMFVDLGDGPLWVGIAWRGYLLHWAYRDKTAIRIGTGDGT